MKKIKIFNRSRSQSNNFPTEVIPVLNPEQSYIKSFLKHKEFKTRQCVYIGQDVHASIARLVHVLALTGKKISVGGYIDNILAEHLDSHKEVIENMYRKQLDQFL